MNAGKQPKAIIIVRHGIRLDQADRNWRATAEFPYDPPLSYGGWIQCQTLGARIGKELQSLNGYTSTPADGEDGTGTKLRPRKKRRIVIHSSPYKRCIQTSVAIAVGLKYPDTEKLRPLSSPYQRASISGPSYDPPKGLGIAFTADGGIVQQSDRLPPNDERHEVKVDPWLGEWLSTGYFEDSVPPPPGNEIIDRAKDTLTIPVEEIRGADLTAFLEVTESIAEDDGDKENIGNTSEKSGLRAMAAAGHSLPHRTRTTSFGRDWTSNARSIYKEKMKSRPRATTYSPPLPQYSLAQHDPIPAGYVAHARDACVKPDLTWDSVAMDCGDGGVYPEEWSQMHIRFRQGLQRLLAYYRNLDNLPTADKEVSEGEEEEEELVLVLVTHQAGANALIRLMTGAPALHDIGVSSLTLAVRRPVLRRPPSLSNTSHSPLGFDRESRRNSRRGSMDLGLADEFEMRIIASTEHLRYGSNPLGLNSPRLGQSPAMTSRRMVGADSLEGFSIGDPLAKRSNSSNTVTRSSGQRTRASDMVAKTTASSGLWGSPAIPATVQEPIEESLEELPPMSPKSRPTTPSVPDNIPETSISSPTRSRSNTVQATGLWGSNNTNFGNLNVRSAPSEGSVNRARSPAKRRWTAVSNSP